MNDVIWEPEVQKKFDLMVGKIPPFLRAIAQQKVARKAEQLAKNANRSMVNEKDMVDAFFAETPFGFHGPMKMDMDEFGIKYTSYGHPQ